MQVRRALNFVQIHIIPYRCRIVYRYSEELSYCYPQVFLLLDVVVQPYICCCCSRRPAQDDLLLSGSPQSVLQDWGCMILTPTPPHHRMFCPAHDTYVRTYVTYMLLLLLLFCFTAVVYDWVTTAPTASGGGACPETGLMSVMACTRGISDCTRHHPVNCWRTAGCPSKGDVRIEL